MDKVPETEQIYYSTGDSTSIMSSASGASVTVSLVDLDKRDRSAQEITKQLRRDLADIAGCEITVSASESMSMSTDSDISVELTGDDYDQLAATADDLVEKLSAIPDAINVESSAGEQTPRVAVKVRRENASRFGLTPAAIGGLVRGELTGSTATTLRMNGEEYDVTVSGDADVATSLDALRSMQLPTATGGNVPLSSVADVYTELSPQSIARKNQKETVTITGESESGDANAITEKVNEVLDSYETPDGVEIGDGDTMASQMAETTGSLMLALAVAIALVYFILATQFNSFALPIAIMLILPIGLLGSMMLLAPTGNHVSMVALLGVIILAGTVVNSSIVLIDYTLQRRERGEDKNTAILNACPRRVRPVPDDRDDHHPRPRADGILERRGLGDDEADGHRHDDRHGHLDRCNAVHHAGLLLADRQHRRVPEKARSPAAPQGRQGQKGRRQRREHGGKPGFCRINPPDYRCKNQ